MGLEVLGSMACPECGRSGAIIKRQKTGRLYRFCAAGCQAQFFARNDEQEKAMRANLAPVPVTGTDRPAAPGTGTAAPAAPKRGFSLGAL